MKITHQIKTIIRNSKNEEIEKYILENIDENKYYAVRSSGIGEDGKEYAFAGMGESVLNVKGSDIIKEIKNVWESFYNDEAIEYMLNIGQFIYPAILIQEMVSSPDEAGVAFSRNESGNSLIDVAEGLGDKVVDGTITPNEIEVNPITGQAIKSNFTKILTPEQIKQLNETIMFLEEMSGYPIDVEFAFKNNNLYILQRRADTKFNNFGPKIQADIKFAETVDNKKEVFCIEYKDEAVPVYVTFDKKIDKITFIATNNNFSLEDKNIILRKIQDRVNNDIVVRSKVNGKIPIINAIAPGQLELIHPIPVDNFEINKEDFEDYKDYKNALDILKAA